METKEQKGLVFSEAYRTNLVTVTSGCETITVCVPKERLMDLLYLLDMFSCDNKEIEKKRIECLLAYKADAYSQYLNNGNN